ncbi:MAG TPA: polyprenol phosphomannose-dependent alpha 1,6 mannosyltransferase MptB, partial [Thermomicrobiales bacterium]|nr:polyprenol phosphomannose-dependent alpha 1,6 mannosyltransferase MptB [Thermomicrobiales bacterium]
MTDLVQPSRVAVKMRPIPLLPVIVLVAVAFCWSVQYPFWPNRVLLLDQGKIVNYSWLAFALFVGGIALWVWALWALFPYMRDATFTRVRGIILPVTAMVYTAFVLMYPTNAIDVYIYAVRSRLLTEYGANPNEALPVSWWETDPYMRFASREWADDTSPYGPLWNQLAAPITALAGDSVGIAVIGFKLLCVIAIVAIGWLIHDAVASRNPGWAVMACLFWLWNPLVLWDGIGNAHNDVVLMVPAVAALWAWTKRYDHMVLPLLFASMLIKYVTVILLPVAIVALWKRNSPAKRVEGA